MKNKLNTAPQFIGWIWVKGKLTSNFEFIGKTGMMSRGGDPLAGVVIVTELGQFEHEPISAERVTYCKQVIVTPFTTVDSKPDFKKPMWVTGNFNNEDFVGVTYILNKREVVALVTQSFKMVYIPFGDIQNLKELSFSDENSEPPISSSLYNITAPTFEEKQILGLLNSINNKK